MNLNCRKNWIVALWALVLANIGGLAQTTALPVTYALQQGSQLVDCPFCGRLPANYPLHGTFLLTRLESNPLFDRYELSDIAFQAGTNNGPQYTIRGNGTYQVGGEVAYQQDLVLNLTIDFGFGQTVAIYSNATRTVKAPWPIIDTSVDQSATSPYPVFQLTIVAAPAPRFISIIPQAATGDVRLEWQTSGQPVQLERAESVDGPFVPLTSMDTNSIHVDMGILLGRGQAFYRLRQKAY
jgi:hypothetical protein